MKRIILITIVSSALMASCVSKKKYVALENDLNTTSFHLAETTAEKEKLEEEKRILEERFSRIEKRVEEYNAKINSLRETNDAKFSIDGAVPMSNNSRESLQATLANVDPEDLRNAKTMEDSVNLAISYNLKKSISDGSAEENEDIQIDIDKTVVMISVSDRLLFNTGSYVVSKKADGLLKKLSEVINSEPSMEVMIEGHTDPRSINTAVLQDNWDLSVKRATSIVRALETKYNVAPEKLIAAGRSSYMPLVENDSPENMAKNRRTRIVIIPDLDKFFALMESE
ncbi:flagellar motor protein [Belliella baltica DSM 15883]|uniref:Flagellar motor protein n=1 Tax=Belliella baltica (strain DSM 15883 / CIP 108006 / LMG 21964 / BA134) TaxID=866536 RepID=I3Z600_BELBD|nr:OmpA family protein [Belliella baltica]AFL84668.1 flagellar motor protein [Belliella baltica DSM 15883]